MMREPPMRRGWSVAAALLAGLVVLAKCPGAGATKRVTFDDGRGNVWEEDVYSEAEYEAYKNRWWNKKMTKLPSQRQPSLLNSWNGCRTRKI